MLRIERVALDSIFPLEDEYGNQYTSRDYSLPANEAYVRELAESMRDKGEPDEPVKLVADGSIYRIKTGNSRVRAMRLLGTRECSAIIDDADTVQSVLEEVLRTNTKKAYEPEELSRYVQQLALFGDDEYVARQSGMEAAQVGKVRRAAKAVQDAAEDMTIEHLLLVDEFADEPEYLERIKTCSNADAPTVAADLRRKRRTAERKEAFRAAFEALGVPCEDKPRKELRYFISVPSPSEAGQYLPRGWKPEDGGVVAVLAGMRAELWRVPGEGGETDAEAEERRLTDAYKEALWNASDSRKEWYWARLASGVPAPAVDEIAAGAFREHWIVKNNVNKAIIGADAYAAAKNGKPSVCDKVIGYKEGCVASLDVVRSAAQAAAKGKVPAHAAKALREHMALVDAHVADGWDMGDATAVYAVLQGLMASTEEGESDGR